MVQPSFLGPAFSRGVPEEIMLPLCAGKEEHNNENKPLGSRACKARYSATAELAVNAGEYLRAIAR